MSSAPRPRWGFDPIVAVMQEREYQQQKWGEAAASGIHHEYAEAALILSREFGEAVQALGRLHWPEDHGRPSPQHTDYADARSELIQVAAVAIAIIQKIDAEVLE